MANNDTEKFIRNLIKQNGGVKKAYSNSPTNYASRQPQYRAKETSRFIAERAKYSSDFVRAAVQGIFPDDFYRYIITSVRLSNVSSSVSASATKLTDDFKLILFADEKIDYFPIGAKLITMGSTWLCVNPDNMSTPYGKAIIQRCNSSYNLYDYYGNIITEPICIERYAMQGNDNESGENLILMDGYFNVTCQLNNNTRLLDQNQRIILGSKAYAITGFVDFMQEFTGDYDSIHILNFTVRIAEPTIDDDLINHITNGKQYIFYAEINGNTQITTSDTTQLTATFITKDGAQTDTEDYPITWEWISSDESIATVDENGLVTAVSAGTAQITAKLSQNSAISATVELVIKETDLQPYVAFTGVLPQSLSQFEEITIASAYFEDGAQTDEEVTWTFSGAGEENYTATVDGNTLTIYCISPSDTALTVTASYGDYSVSTEIALLGY